MLARHRLRLLAVETLFDGWPDLRAFYESVRMSMPADEPMALSSAEYVDILAYVLSVNGYPQGPNELTANPDDLERIVLKPSAR